MSFIMSAFEQFAHTYGLHRGATKCAPLFSRRINPGWISCGKHSCKRCQTLLPELL